MSGLGIFKFKLIKGDFGRNALGDNYAFLSLDLRYKDITALNVYILNTGNLEVPISSKTKYFE